MSNETSARVEGETVVLCQYCNFTQANHIDGTYCSINRVCEFKAARPKVGESGLSDELSAKQKVLAATEERGWLPGVLHRASLESLVIRWVQDKATDQELRDLRDVISKPTPEAKPEPLPNTRQEEQSLSYEVRKQLWLTHGCGIACLYGDDGEMQCGRFHPFIDFRSDGEAAILEGIEIHCQKRWLEIQAAAPKVVDSKEEQEEYKGPCGNVPNWFADQRPKVEEQDGEQELPPMDEEWHQGPRQWDDDTTCRERQLRAALREIKLLKAESVAPPSLPKQDTEIDVAEAIQLMQEIHGEHDRCNRYRRCACWVCSRIDVILASRAPAPVALPKHPCTCGAPEFGIEPCIMSSSCTPDYSKSAVIPVALPTHQIVERTVQAAGYMALRCSCGRIFVGIGDEALASSRASFEAHLPEKEGK